MTDGPGLTVARFLASISDSHVRGLLDPGLLPVLDALFPGQLAGPDLRRVAQIVVDVDALLCDSSGRRRLLSLLPEHKRLELEARAGRVTRSPDEWTAGQLKALRDFFGLLDDAPLLPAAPALRTITPSYALFDHQRRAVEQLVPLLASDERRAVLHLPTGVGKTRTAMHVVARWLRDNDPSVVVWLASGKELLEQAVHAFADAWTSLGTRPVHLDTMWGDHSPDLDGFSDGFLAIGLAKAWAAISRTDPTWGARLAPRVRLVVFDEAHQCVAPTYRRITQELTLDFRCSILGLTATPGRSWADIDEDGELAAFFSGNKVTLDTPGANPIAYLTEHGFLAKARFRTLFSQPGIRLSDAELSRISAALELPDEIISQLSLSERYVTAVLSAIHESLQAGHARILVFAATVDHARVLAAVLIARNIRCSVVTASTPQRVRARAIAAFRTDDAEPMVLVNFGVLTTGFDAPKASAIVIARPTQSLVLYSQMVGRGIRGPRVGGTESCEILTVVDPSLPGFGDVAAAFLNWEDVWQ